MKPDEIITLYSEKYDIFGQIQDYGAVMKLCFVFGGREHAIGMDCPGEGDMTELGLRIMENAIEKLLSRRKDSYLHYWYIDGGKGGMIAHGVVTGHSRLPDTMHIHTSRVLDIQIDEEKEEAVVTTGNTIYHCPLSYCEFSKQDSCPGLIPDYGRIREHYKGKLKVPETEPGKVLLVISDFSEYYFHSLCAKDENGEVRRYIGIPHEGLVHDSFMIKTYDCKIDLRYLPDLRVIELYTAETDGMPLYVENVGGSDIYVRMRETAFGSGMLFRVKPGERKELSKENAEDPGADDSTDT